MFFFAIGSARTEHQDLDLDDPLAEAMHPLTTPRHADARINEENPNGEDS